MLNYRFVGQGPVLVFFHGWGFDHTVWQVIIQDLQSIFTLCLVDLPGFGQSSLMSWHAFKHTLLQALPASFALVGWSMGGLWATRLALEAQQRVTHLINVASSPYFIKSHDWPGIKKNSLDDFLQQLIVSPKSTLRQFIKLQYLNATQCIYEVPARINMSGLQSGLLILKNWDLRLSLLQLAMPVGYLFGRRDSIVPCAIMTTMQENYPFFYYQLFDFAAHMPFLTDKTAFIAALKEFLQ